VYAGAVRLLARLNTVSERCEGDKLSLEMPATFSVSISIFLHRNRSGRYRDPWALNRLSFSSRDSKRCCNATFENRRKGKETLFLCSRHFTISSTDKRRALTLPFQPLLGLVNQICSKHRSWITSSTLLDIEDSPQIVCGTTRISTDRWADLDYYTR